MIIFTSIASNYIPKARILARSVKRHCPNTKFVAVLCDKAPAEFNDSIEPFDAVLTLRDLDIPVPNLPAWIFSHSVVELCTAVKGAALLKIFERYGVEKVVYLDPDIVVLDNLDEVNERLDHHSVLVTPHLTEPYSAMEPLLDQEVGLLQHGIFNFGFLAVRNNHEGNRFAKWWRDRLLHFCYVDLPRGLFTDQRWGDLIPVFFPDSYIMREKTYNVATWNLLQRKVEVNAEGKLFVEGEPVRFYHFSGFDSGLFKLAFQKYGQGNEGIAKLHQWYVAEMAKEGQATLGETPFFYSFFEDGTPITLEHRTFYRQRPSLAEFFPDPFSTHNPKESFLQWYQKKEARESLSGNPVASPEVSRTYRTLIEKRSPETPH